MHLRRPSRLQGSPSAAENDHRGLRRAAGQTSRIQSIKVPAPAGIRKLRKGAGFLSHAVIAIRAMRDRDGGGSEGEEMDRSVLD